MMKITTPTRMDPFSSSSDNVNRQIATPPASKANKQIATQEGSILEKLKCLINETLDHMMKEEETKKGVSVTKEDLVGWGEQLDNDGKHEYALESGWLEFSPSDHALFVDLLAKTKGHPAARDYFYKLEPDFNRKDQGAKLMPWLREGDKKSILRPAIIRIRKGEPRRVQAIIRYRNGERINL